jgi:hypothetical protein
MQAAFKRLAQPSVQVLEASRSLRPRRPLIQDSAPTRVLPGRATDTGAVSNVQPRQARTAVMDHRCIGGFADLKRADRGHLRRVSRAGRLIMSHVKSAVWAARLPALLRSCGYAWGLAHDAGGLRGCTASKLIASRLTWVRAIGYAARWYSLITPPRTLRRWTGRSSGGLAWPSWSGGRCWRDWCGRCRL